MVIGTVAAVASGVGAVGLGAAALVRAGVGMAAKTAVRKGITQTIIKSAQESVKQTIKNPVAQEKVLGVLRGEVSDTVKFLVAPVPAVDAKPIPTAPTPVALAFEPTATE